MMMTLARREQNVFNGLLEHIHRREHQINHLRKQRNNLQPASAMKGLFREVFTICNIVRTRMVVLLGPSVWAAGDRTAGRCSQPRQSHQKRPNIPDPYTRASRRLDL